MKTRFNKTYITQDASEKIAPYKGIGRLSENPKLKEILEKYGSHENKENDLNTENDSNTENSKKAD